MSAGAESEGHHGRTPGPERLHGWLEAAPGHPEQVPASRRFRDVLGRFASGVTVVTGVGPDGPVGLTCQAFSSVSLDPPLVLFVPSRGSRSWAAIRASGRFCVNVLAADQDDLSDRMATTDIDKFAGIAWEPSRVTGSPLFKGTLAYVDCRIEAVHEAGDHYIVVGRVLDLDHSERAEPLLYYRGEYRTSD